MHKIIARTIETCFFCGDEIHPGAFCHVNSQDADDNDTIVICDQCYMSDYTYEDYYNPEPYE